MAGIQETLLNQEATVVASSGIPKMPIEDDNSMISDNLQGIQISVRADDERSIGSDSPASPTNLKNLEANQLPGQLSPSEDVKLDSKLHKLHKDASEGRSVARKSTSRRTKKVSTSAVKLNSDAISLQLMDIAIPPLPPIPQFSAAASTVDDDDAVAALDKQKTLSMKKSRSQFKMGTSASKMTHAQAAATSFSIPGFSGCLSSLVGFLLLMWAVCIVLVFFLSFRRYTSSSVQVSVKRSLLQASLTAESAATSGLVALWSTIGNVQSSINTDYYLVPFDYELINSILSPAFEQWSGDLVEIQLSFLSETSSMRVLRKNSVEFQQCSQNERLNINIRTNHSSCSTAAACSWGVVCDADGSSTMIRDELWYTTIRNLWETNSSISHQSWFGPSLMRDEATEGFSSTTLVPVFALTLGIRFENQEALFAKAVIATSRLSSIFLDIDVDASFLVTADGRAVATNRRDLQITPTSMEDGTAQLTFPTIWEVSKNLEWKSLLPSKLESMVVMKDDWLMEIRDLGVSDKSMLNGLFTISIAKQSSYEDTMVVVYWQAGFYLAGVPGVLFILLILWRLFKYIRSLPTPDWLLNIKDRWKGY